MLMLDRRTLLKTLASAAGIALAGRFTANRFVYADDKIPGADDSDPMTPGLMKVKVGIRKVADNLWVLLGAGGNIGLFDGRDGVIIIDAGLPERAKDVAAAIRIVTQNPANLLINTHYHFDHTGGNEAVHALGFPIAAHANVRKRLSEKITIDFMQHTEDPKPEAARPTLTFENAITVHANGDTLSLVHVPPAHTDGDSYILFEKAGVLQSGDLFFNGFYPFIDYSTGGSIDGMIAAEEKLLAITDDKTKIIPGHGAVCGKADLQKALDMLKTVRDKIKPFVDAGKSAEETVAAKPLAVLEGKFSKGFLDDDKFTTLVHYTCSRAGK